MKSPKGIEQEKKKQNKILPTGTTLSSPKTMMRPASSKQNNLNQTIKHFSHHLHSVYIK